MDMMDKLLDIRVNYKNSYRNGYLKKLFCEAYCFNFSLVSTAILSNILF